MTATGFQVTITEDGSYVFPRVDAERGVFQVTLASGTGTITPGYDDGAGNFAAFTDASGITITATATASWAVTVPASGLLALTLASASSAVLSATFAARH